uniref:Uncharacterized protein n=1 Tax=Anguilla anguilla TaxID=7936 RepID=A0A0E9RJQ4_ANGAN
MRGLFVLSVCHCSRNRRLKSYALWPQRVNICDCAVGTRVCTGQG